MSADERFSELARRWEGLKLAVGHASMECIALRFHRSMFLWQELGGDKQDKSRIEVSGDLEVPLSLPQSRHENVVVVIHGDCRADISLPGGGLVQIYGDLSKTITIGGQGEIVIGGNVLPEAVIQADGIHSVFVGGDLSGKVHSTDSLSAHVSHDFNGLIKTGTPSTFLHINGDSNGQIQPTDDAALLSLIVEGFMPYSILESISEHGYTRFQASVAMSTRSPGIYPDREQFQRLAGQRHYCHWVIRHAPRAERYRQAKRA